jgi:hypothetical protein
MSPIPEAHEHRPDLHPLAGLDVDPRDPAAEGRGQLDLGLLRLDEEDGLVLLDLIPLGHEHLDDLGLGQTFTQIGQLELSGHAVPPRRGGEGSP